MNDLVFLRELIRPPGNSGAQREISRVFRRVDFDCISECFVTRAAPTCSPIAIALTLNVLGVKSVNARIRSAKDVTRFDVWYAKRLDTLAHIDVAPSRLSGFRCAMGRLCILACDASLSLQVPNRGPNVERLTRPVSIILSELHLRSSKSPVGSGSVSISNPHRKKRAVPSSPRAIRMIASFPEGATPVAPRLSEEIIGRRQNQNRWHPNHPSRARNIIISS